jgi:hypothetical protein
MVAVGCEYTVKAGEVNPGGKPHDERDSSRRSADDRPWMDFEDQQ